MTHGLRSIHDAILVGAGTVRQDNPRFASLLREVWYVSQTPVRPLVAEWGGGAERLDDNNCYMVVVRIFSRCRGWVHVGLNLALLYPSVPCPLLSREKAFASVSMISRNPSKPVHTLHSRLFCFRRAVSPSSHCGPPTHHCSIPK